MYDAPPLRWERDLSLPQGVVVGAELQPDSTAGISLTSFCEHNFACTFPFVGSVKLLFHSHQHYLMWLHCS